MSSNDKLLISERTKVKTMKKRGFYDFKTITEILDDTFICYIGFAVDNLPSTKQGPGLVQANQPFVIPTCYGRRNNKIFFHGAKGSRLLKTIRSGAEICITVTIMDGIVLARSALNHCINYRSVVMFGQADEIVNPVEKTNALKIITDHIIPDRWDNVREPDKKELNATAVFSFKIDEASAKIRKGFPNDKEEDMKLNVWAGVLPLKIIAEEPVKDLGLNEDIPIPEYIKNYRRNLRD